MLVEAWRKIYNRLRPHSSLGYRPPSPETQVVGKFTLGLAQCLGAGQELIAKIILLAECDRIFKMLSRVMGNNASILRMSIKDDLNEIVIEMRNAHLVISHCEYDCDFGRCLTKFILSRISKTPFALLRRSLPLRVPPEVYFLTLFEAIEIPSVQANILSRIKNSDLYAFSPYWIIHPGNPIHRIMEIQKEIAQEFPIKKPRDFASSRHLSLAWLSHNFKMVTKMGLSDYIRRNSFCSSLWQLVSTDLLIKTIALEHGYRPHSFSRRFKELFQHEPSSAREYTNILGLLPKNYDTSHKKRHQAKIIRA